MQATFTANTLRITFDGDLISSNVDALRTQILFAMAQHPSAQTIVTDLINARMIDSKGINLLIALYRETQSRKISLIAENPTADIRRLLGLLKLSERFGLSA